MNKIVSEQEWQAALEAFRIKEKEYTRLRDALNAERRRLPVTEITKAYEFTGTGGKISLPDLFDGRKQLIVYHFMFAESPCTGCSMMVDNMGHNAHIHARDTSRVLVSLAPIDHKPTIPEGHALREHVLYKITNAQWNAIAPTVCLPNRSNVKRP